MERYTIDVSPEAQKELKHHYKSGDQVSIKRIERIFSDLQEHPYSGIGNPEALKYALSKYYSRRINKKDRLI